MDYHNNSSINQPQAPKSREPAKPVIKAGSAKIAKKNFIRQMWDDLVVSDLPTLKQTVVNNILIPGLKQLFYNMITGAAANIFYNGRTSSAPPPVQTYSNPSYNTRGQGYWVSQQQMQTTPQPAKLYNDILFDNAGAAQTVLSEMQLRVQQYGNVMVADMFTMAGLPNSNYILARWGWSDLSNASIVPGPNGGFIINLPTPVYF